MSEPDLLAHNGATSRNFRKQEVTLKRMQVRSSSIRGDGIMKTLIISLKTSFSAYSFVSGTVQEGIFCNLKRPFRCQLA